MPTKFRRKSVPPPASGEPPALTHQLMLASDRSYRCQSGRSVRNQRRRKSTGDDSELPLLRIAPDRRPSGNTCIANNGGPMPVSDMTHNRRQRLCRHARLGWTPNRPPSVRRRNAFRRSVRTNNLRLTTDALRSDDGAVEETNDIVRTCEHRWTPARGRPAS